MTDNMIIRDNAGFTFRVIDSTSYELAFIAVPVKRTKDGWIDKVNANPRLVRRSNSTIVGKN